MSTTLWTKDFVVGAAENATVTGLAAFAGSLNFTNGVPSVKGVIAGATAGGLAFLYAFVKNLGGVQTAKAAAKAAKAGA
jgi:hypothetical protein